MTDTAVVLVAAFGGGLAGAVLQPATQWAFDQLRGNAERRRSKMRRQRRMVESWLRYGSGVMTTAHTLAELRRHGVTVSDDGLLRMIFRNKDAEYWIPSLIEDDELRTKGESYYDAIWELGAKLWDSTISPDEMMKLVANAGELQGSMIDRMEQLALPHPDG